MNDFFASRFAGVFDRRTATREWLGDAYAVVTDGTALLAVRGLPTEDTGRELPANALTSLGDRAGVTCSLSALREWLGPDDLIVNEAVADACAGCDGDGVRECDECGHETSCKSCKGTGDGPTTHTEARAVNGRPGIIAGMDADMSMGRSLLRHVLPDTDEDVIVDVQPTMVRVCGDGWAAVAMARRGIDDAIGEALVLGGAA